MNEKDPEENVLQSPILTPETMSPNKTGKADPSDAVSPSKALENASTKHRWGAKILIGSLAVLLLAGGVTAAVLAKTGAFSKETVTSTEATSGTTVAEESSSQDPTEETAPHRSIVELNQVTDKQFQFMDEKAREYIRDDANNYEGMPDEVEIDAMYCLGMLRQCYEYTGDPETEHDIVQMVYQVQVTDNTGDEPVKRQFFWMCGFGDVYQDGTINPTRTEGMWEMICYDNWTMQGCLDLKKLVREAESMYTLLENGIDESLVQPFDDGNDEEEDYSIIKSLDQITDVMEEEFKKGAEEWQQVGMIVPGKQTGGMVVEDIEYAGLALTVTNNKTMNRVYVIYKIDVTDLNGTTPTSRSIYWYTSFSGIFQGGQMQTRMIEEQSVDPVELSEWAEVASTIDELREYIQYHEDLGWLYEDAF